MKPADVYPKMARYCAFRERCTHEVREKLRPFHLTASGEEEIIKQLQQEGFLDDIRFAQLFVRGKFNNNHWGRIKLTYELRARKIGEKVIVEALNSIDEAAYKQKIRDLIQKKTAEINPEKSVQIREKLLNFVLRKGYEMDIALRVLNETT
jgi:regulatory protein